MGRGRRLATVSIAITAVSLVASCGLFQTRDPLRPDPPASGCRSLTGPGAVVANTEDPVVGYGRTAGLTCYGSMLDALFAFHPAPQDSQQALPETPFVGWNATVEGQVNSNIARAQDYLLVDFQREYAPASISPDQTSEVHFYEYVVLFSAKDSTDTLRFTGLADITFRRGGDGQWRMTDWVDNRGAVSDSTWGRLRREYRF